MIMPHNNKKPAFQNNTKKNKRNESNGRPQHQQAQQEQMPTLHSNLLELSTNLPSLQKQQQQQLLTDYSRYKIATEEFKKCLFQLVPSTALYTPKTTTSNCKHPDKHPTTHLIDAVEYIYNQVVMRTFIQNCEGKSDRNIGIGDTSPILTDENDEGARSTNITIDPQMMLHLKTAIRIRRSVMKTYEHGGDKGHRHYCDVLKYCWDILKKIINFQISDINGKIGKTEDGTPNDITSRFAEMSIVLDDTEICDDEGDHVIKSSQEKLRPVDIRRKRQIPPNIYENSDDYFYVHMFLHSINTMMSYVSEHYQKLKLKWRERGTSGRPDTSFIEDLMEASTYVNFCLQQIKIMESEHCIQYPYLNTPYRMMVAIVHTEAARTATRKIWLELSSKSSSLEEKYTLSDTIAFLGDIVEASFRSPSSARGKVDPIVSSFCTKWSISTSTVLAEVETFRIIKLMETPTLPDKLDGNNSYTESDTFQPHSWLKRFKYIGGKDRCILHTMRLLQGISSIAKKGTLLHYFKRGFFGRLWNEESNPASKITDDMDEFLMGDILPILFNMCTDGMLSRSIPMENELLTFFTVMKSFTTGQDETVSWTFAFAIHALLTSVFEMQGQNDVQELGSVANLTYNFYIDQITTLSRDDAILKQSKDWKVNLSRMTSLLLTLVHSPRIRGQNTSKHDGLDRKTMIDYALWNPLCSGLFIQFLCYYSNLDRGLFMLDSCSPLRIVLHLYNALKQVGATSICDYDCDVMEWLYDTFKDCNTIWEGPLPRKGEFVKRMWIAVGASIPCAQQLSNETHARLKSIIPIVNAATLSFRCPQQVPYIQRRTVTPILPGDISVSFKRICLHDFTNLEDRYHTKEQRSTSRGKVMYELALKNNDTSDNMNKEQRILASNVVVVGNMLNTFIEKLFDVLGWTSLIDEIVSKAPESQRTDHCVDGTRVVPNSCDTGDINLQRQAMVYIIAERLLGGLDVIPDDCVPKIDPCFVRTLACFSCHFHHENHLQDILFFSPCVDEN